MIKRWKVVADVTILCTFKTCVIVKAPNIYVARIRGYNKLKFKYVNSSSIYILNIKEV